MTLIANPIYDSVFKYLMEDDRVAKILLSALLKKEIVELQMRRQEYSACSRRASPCSGWTSPPVSVRQMEKSIW